MFFKEIFSFNPFRENTYVLYNESKEALLIDPGCYFSEEIKMFEKFLNEKELKPVKLLNTHCHLDHVFGNNTMYEKYGTELYIHPDSEQVLDLSRAAGERWELPFENYTGPLHFLEEGDTVCLGEDMLKVLFTPGHCPGSICFYCEKQNFIIAGDVLFKGSIGRTDLPGADFVVLEKSIREKLYPLPDNVHVLSGHGAPTTIGEEKATNPFVSG
jgi:glyoxylase-like metal-dependent hydrolase (beta-lactamase superfamily II)